MRRIYDSPAVTRDDGDSFSPNEREDVRPQAMRSVPGTALSRLLVPDWLRYRAVSVSVSTPRTEYPAGEPVPFRVEMKNAMPFPVEIPTRSPVLWTWTVDGLPEASRISRDPPAERRGFRFDRGERKRFARRWRGYFRVSESEWEPADPGEYAIGAGLNVEDAAAKGLADEVTVRLVPE
jgi:hypothetical protein